VGVIGLLYLWCFFLFSGLDNRIIIVVVVVLVISIVILNVAVYGELYRYNPTTVRKNIIEVLQYSFWHQCSSC
jgi:hypothetical protein